VYAKPEVTIAYDVPATTLASTLSALVGSPGSVAVSRTGPTTNGGYRWTITFPDQLGPSACPQTPCLEVRTTSLGGATILNPGAASVTLTKVVPGVAPDFAASGVATTVVRGAPEVQTVTLTRASTTLTPSNALAGTFSLSLNGEVATGIPFDATAVDVKRLVETIRAAGSVTVTRSFPAPADPAYGYVWTITFDTVDGDVAQLVAARDGTLTTTGAVLTAATRTTGVPVPRTTQLALPSTALGLPVFAQVRAGNQAGLGPSTATEQGIRRGVTPLQALAASAPGQVALSSVTPLSGTQAQVAWSAPATQGSPISSYRVDWWTSGAEVAEVGGWVGVPES
jgi:hypothetical protein